MMIVKHWYLLIKTCLFKLLLLLSIQTIFFYELSEDCSKFMMHLSYVSGILFNSFILYQLFKLCYQDQVRWQLLPINKNVLKQGNILFSFSVFVLFEFIYILFFHRFYVYHLILIIVPSIVLEVLLSYHNHK